MTNISIFLVVLLHFSCSYCVSDYITHGIVGAVSSSSAKLFFRFSSQEIEVAFQVEIDDEKLLPTGKISQNQVSLGQQCMVIELADLIPNSGYHISAIASDQNGNHLQTMTLRFHTFPREGEPCSFKFVFSSCLGEGYNNSVCVEIADSKPSFYLFLGDLIYADHFADMHPDKMTVGHYSGFYLNKLGDPYVSNLTARVPGFFTWDDHELVNDYSAGRGDIFPEDVIGNLYYRARIAYDRFVHSHNPDSLDEGTLYYSFDVCDTSFFVMDTRSHRSYNKESDGPHKTMLGLPQLNQVKNWLLNSKATIKFLVSSVMWSDFAEGASKNGAYYLESWFRFKHERTDLFRFIVKHHIDNVILLSGDSHWPLIARLHLSEKLSLYEFQVSPLSAFGLPPTRNESSDILFTFNTSAHTSNQFYGVFEVNTFPQVPIAKFGLFHWMDSNPYFVYTVPLQRHFPSTSKPTLIVLSILLISWLSHRLLRYFRLDIRRVFHFRRVKGESSLKAV